MSNRNAIAWPQSSCPRDLDPYTRYGHTVFNQPHSSCLSRKTDRGCEMKRSTSLEKDATFQDVRSASKAQFLALRTLVNLAKCRLLQFRLQCVSTNQTHRTDCHSSSSANPKSSGALAVLQCSRICLAPMKHGVVATSG